MLLGGLYSVTKNSIKALEEYKTAISIDPEKPDAYFYMGTIYADIGELDKSLEIMNKLLKIDPNSLLGNYYIGRIYANKKLFSEAEVYFKRRWKSSPTLIPP